MLSVSDSGTGFLGGMPAFEHATVHGFDNGAQATALKRPGFSSACFTAPC